LTIEDQILASYRLVGSLSKARQIIRLRIQLIRHYTKPLSDIGRIIGDASHFYRGHAQKWDRQLLRSG